MDYWSRLLVLVSVLVAAELSLHPVVASWQKEWFANYVSKKRDISPIWAFDGHKKHTDHFKLLLVEKDKAFIGGRNKLYYASLGDFKEPVTLEWEPDAMAAKTCKRKGKTACQNYIRVILRKSEDLFYICGTNAYQPKCRHYKLQDGKFVMVPDSNESGVGVCPYEPSHNSTALFTDGKLYSATVSDSDSRNPHILLNANAGPLMTHPRDSTVLNEPDFVSSFEKEDKVLFFFRETAIEHINCGKAVFSRVGQVCKQDRGGAIDSFRETFTSFFKARLNCSIPGEFPFYFDEIQSTTEIGQGNYMPTSDSGNRFDMVYGVFNTPENSIRGSAVCAYQYSDITNSFRGRFKGQTDFKRFWLPVEWDSTPNIQMGKKSSEFYHLSQCTNNSMGLPFETLNFMRTHPLMDEAVPAKGGRPMLVFTSFTSRFTQIAVDWQVLAADGHYYDVMFVGTDDGRVIKAINVSPDVESVVIEDIQVLPKGEAVTSLKVVSSRVQREQEKLMVMSKERIVAIPLYRCHKAVSCSACVGLQDPYCTWNMKMGQCISAEAGIQSVETGEHESCKAEEERELPMSTPAPVVEECKCPEVLVEAVQPEEKNYEQKDKTSEGKQISGEKPSGQEDPNGPKTLPSSAQTVEARVVSTDIFVIVIVVCIIFSLLIGFLIGFKVQSCRYNRDNVFYESRSLPRGIGRNRLSSGDNPFFHTDHTSLAPKKLNHVVNMKNGKSNTETIPVTKSNKVYL